MDKLQVRKNNRLKSFDYSQVGYYFITICTKDKKNLFWNVGETCGRPHHLPLSISGKIADTEINKINLIYEKDVEINKYIIMPNHIHMIIILHAENGRLGTTPTISRIIQQFKGSVSKQVGFSLWQKSFHDHIIRNQQEYEKIYEYIETNPLKWEEDKYYEKQTGQQS